MANKRIKKKKARREFNLRSQEKYIKYATREQLLNLDTPYIKSFTDEEYRRYMRRLARIANERVSNIRENGLESYAVTHYVENGGGLFGRNDYKDRNAMVKEVNRINNFLKNKSSTVNGIMEMRQKAADTIFATTGLVVDITGEAGNRLFKILDKLKSNLTEEMIYKMYRRTLDFANDLSSFTNDNIDEVLELAEETGKELYVNFVQTSQTYKMTPAEQRFLNMVDESLEKWQKHGY